MSKQINLRLSKEILKPIKIHQIENNFEDVQDAIRDILEKYILSENKPKSFFSKLKNLFMV